MKFSGRFADFSLPDVLRIIVHSQKTGFLQITFKNSQSRIFVSQGRIYHAESEGLQGEKAIYNLMTYDPVAEFEFIESETLPIQTISSELDTLVQNGIEYLEVWRKLTRQYPLLSVHMVVRLQREPSHLECSDSARKVLDLLRRQGSLKLYQLTEKSALNLPELVEQLFNLEKEGFVQIIGEERIELQQFFLEMANTLFSEFESISGLKLKEEIIARLEKFIAENNWNLELQNGRIVGDKIRINTIDEQKQVFSGYLKQLIGLIQPIYGAIFIQQVMQKVEQRFSAPIQHWVDELKIEV